MKALKILLSDPIGGQFEALKNLGSSNAIKAGLVLIIFFTGASYLLAHSMIAGFLKIAAALKGDAGVNFSMYLKLFIFSLVPSASILSGYLLIMKVISKENLVISTCIFTTGITTIPLSILFLCIKLFGLANAELLCVIGVFCISTTFLLINSSLQDIYKLSTKKSVFLTPTLVLLSLYISKVLYATLF